MKKINLIIIVLVAFLVNLTTAKAAPTSTFTVSRSTIENQQSVTATVTIRNVAAWNVRITSSGNTTGCTSSFADTTADGSDTTKTFSVTCKASSVGLIGFTLSGDATSSADGATINLSGSRTVSVTAITPKSSNNYLKSLSVEGYELSPNFLQDNSEYNLIVPNEVRKIKLNATKADSRSSITGIGEIELEEGENQLIVAVKAENGATREYVINITVSELDPIKVIVDGKELSVVRKKDLLTAPSTFIESTTIINGETVPSLTSDITGYTVVGLRDEGGNINLYIYDEETSTYRIYRELKIDGLILHPLTTNETIKGYIDTVVTIDGVEYKAFKKNNNSEYYVIYGINTVSGKSGWYVYDKVENTLQRFDKEISEETVKDIKLYQLLTYIFGATTAICFILILAQISKASKMNKKIEQIIEAKNHVAKITEQKTTEIISEEKLVEEAKNEEIATDETKKDAIKTEKNDELVDDTPIQKETKKKKSKKKK